MSGTRRDIQVAEEWNLVQTKGEPPEDWGKSRRIRFALLSGEPLSAVGSAARFGGSDTSLYAELANLKELGFEFSKDKRTYRLVDSNGSRSTKKKRAPRKRRPAEPEQGPPKTPSLGATLRVSVLVDGGEDIVVGLDGDGVRWWVHLEPGYGDPLA